VAAAKAAWGDQEGESGEVELEEEKRRRRRWRRDIGVVEDCRRRNWAVPVPVPYWTREASWAGEVESGEREEKSWRKKKECHHIRTIWVCTSLQQALSEFS
jgi:hypothetical protein